MCEPFLHPVSVFFCVKDRLECVQRGGCHPSVYSVHCTLYTIQFTVYSEQCKVCSVQCTVCSEGEAVIPPYFSDKLSHDGWREAAVKQMVQKSKTTGLMWEENN